MMRQVFPVIAALLFFTASPVLAGGYSEEVHTFLTCGSGYESGGSLFFLINHRLYQPARGILAFPDGGISRTVSEGLYLMEFRNGELSVQGSLTEDLPARSAVKSARVFLLEEGLVFYLPRGGSGEYRKICWEAGFSAVDSPAELPPPQEPLIREVTSDFTRQLFLDHYPLTNLPSPAEAAGKKKRAFFRDVVELRGDILYRRAVIREAGFSRKELEALLAAMGERADRLEGYKASEYGFYSEDTRAAVLKELSYDE